MNHDHSHPLIAIITVVRNGENCIESTIQSVLSQTYRNVQFAIIDGASTDNTVNIIQKYSAVLDYWISEPDTGIYDAMNKGIVATSAPWVIFMNAGDSFYDNSVLENFAHFLKKGTLPDLVYGDVLMIYPGEKEQKRELSHSFVFLIRNMICHQSIFYSRSLFRRLGSFNTKYRVTADFDHLIRAKWSRLKISKLNFVVSRYRMDGISSEKSAIAQIWKERIQIFQQSYNAPFFARWVYWLYATAAYEIRKRV